MKNSNRTVVMESDKGVIYRVQKISSALFNFYVLKKREYKDGTFLWHVCVEMASDTSKYMVLDSVRGDKDAAVRRLDQLLKDGK